MSKFWKIFISVILIIMIVVGTTLGIVTNGFRKWNKIKDIKAVLNNELNFSEKKEIIKDYKKLTDDYNNLLSSYENIAGMYYFEEFDSYGLTFYNRKDNSSFFIYDNSAYLKNNELQLKKNFFYDTDVEYKVSEIEALKTNYEDYFIGQMTNVEVLQISYLNNYLFDVLFYPSYFPFYGYDKIEDSESNPEFNYSIVFRNEKVEEKYKVNKEEYELNFSVKGYYTINLEENVSSENEISYKVDIVFNVWEVV